jgi:hypothetical protein
MALGISPDQHSPRHLHDPSEVLQLRREHRLQRVMPALQDLLADDSVTAGTCWCSPTPAARSCGGWAAGRRCGGRTGWSSPGGRLVRGGDRYQRHQRGPGHWRGGAAVLRRAPGPHPPRLGVHRGARRGPGHRPAAGRAGRFRAAGHHQRGHAADGAVRSQGGGVATGNVRRRSRLGFVFFRAGVAAGVSAGLRLQFHRWSCSGTGRPRCLPTGAACR